MKFKVDENLPRDIAGLIARAGFEADTVGDEGLSGSADDVLADTVRAQRRVMVTLDTDFGNIRAYPPDLFVGIIVLRPALQDKPTVIELVRRLIPVLRGRLPDGELWIVEPDRIRFRGRA